MASNDKFQTHKQYRARKQRVKKAVRFDKKSNKLKNEIEDIDIEIEYLMNEKNKKLQEMNKIEEDKVNFLSRTYNDLELLEEINCLVSKTTFSANIIREIKGKCINGINEDNIQKADIESLLKMDTVIMKQIPHTNCFFDILDSFGENIEVSKEEEE